MGGGGGGGGSSKSLAMRVWLCESGYARLFDCCEDVCYMAKILSSCIMR